MILLLVFKKISGFNIAKFEFMVYGQYAPSSDPFMTVMRGIDKNEHQSIKLGSYICNTLKFISHTTHNNCVTSIRIMLPCTMNFMMSQ